MPVAHVNGTDLYYERHGTGFPLVFIHGGFGGLGTGQGGQACESPELMSGEGRGSPE